MVLDIKLTKWVGEEYVINWVIGVGSYNFCYIWHTEFHSFDKYLIGSVTSVFAAL